MSDYSDQAILSVRLPVPAGQSPSALRFDPQESLLLAVNHDSGDIAIIRVRTNYLIPVGDNPTDLAVKLF
jgi:hypothetical protein